MTPVSEKNLAILIGKNVPLDRKLEIFKRAKALRAEGTTVTIQPMRKNMKQQIEKLEGNGLMTQDFVQSLVRCARRICNECEWIELIEFIRLYLWCTPTVHDVYLYKENFNDESFAELLDNLDLDESEVGEEIKLFAVVDKDCLKE